MMLEYRFPNSHIKSKIVFYVFLLSVDARSVRSCVDNYYGVWAKKFSQVVYIHYLFLFRKKVTYGQLVINFAHVVGYYFMLTFLEPGMQTTLLPATQLGVFLPSSLAFSPVLQELGS